jgi:hypothetical protein
MLSKHIHVHPVFHSTIQKEEANDFPKQQSIGISAMQSHERRSLRRLRRARKANESTSSSHQLGFREPEKGV